LLTGPSGRGDPLNQPRLTIGGKIVAHPEPSARARFLARNPKAKLYASFADFSLFRAEISAVHFNGASGAPPRLTPPDILTDMAGAKDLIEAEAALLAEVNGARGPIIWPRWQAMNGATTDGDGAPSASIPMASTCRGRARAVRANFAAPAATAQAWREALDASFGKQAG